MDIQDRILEAEQKFKTEQDRQGQLKAELETCNQELLRIQGEYRALKAIAEEDKTAEPSVEVKEEEKTDGN